MSVCPSCGFEQSSRAKFCRGCGAPYPGASAVAPAAALTAGPECVACHHSIPAGVRFCRYCGARQRDVPAAENLSIAKPAVTSAHDILKGVALGPTFATPLQSPEPSPSPPRAGEVPQWSAPDSIPLSPPPRLVGAEPFHPAAAAETVNVVPEPLATSPSLSRAPQHASPTAVANERQSVSDAAIFALTPFPASARSAESQPAALKSLSAVDESDVERRTQRPSARRAELITDSISEDATLPAPSSSRRVWIAATVSLVAIIAAGALGYSVAQRSNSPGATAKHAPGTVTAQTAPAARAPRSEDSTVTTAKRNTETSTPTLTLAGHDHPAERSPTKDIPIASANLQRRPDIDRANAIGRDLPIPTSSGASPRAPSSASPPASPTAAPAGPVAVAEELPPVAPDVASPVVPATVPAVPVMPPAAAVDPSPQQNPPAESAPYQGPSSGMLTYSGPPVVENGEIVFRNLPPGRLTLTYDQSVWEARLSPGEANTQRLILRNKKPGTQKKCIVNWRLNQ